MSRKANVRDLGGTGRIRDLVEAPAQTADIDDLAVTTAKLADDSVTNPKLANMAQNTIKGRVTASTGDPEDLTPSQGRQVLGLSYGLQTIWEPAGGMTGYVGAAPGQTTYSNGNFHTITFDFDQTTQEVVCFTVAMPKSWDKGNVFFIPYWTATGGSGGVVWQFFSEAISDGDDTATTLPNSVTSIDTFQSANKLHIGPTTNGFTPDASPANDDLILIDVARAPAHGSDTLTADARLIGVKVLYTVSAGNDS